MRIAKASPPLGVATVVMAPGRGGVTCVRGVVTRHREAGVVTSGQWRPASDARELIEERCGEDEGVGQLMHRHPHQVVRAPSVRGLGQVLG